MPFVKPSKVADDLKTRFKKFTGQPTALDTRVRYTDTMEFLSAGLLISYKGQPGGGYPTAAQKAACVAGANMAKKVIFKANEEMAKVVLLRKDESPVFQQIMDTHFGLIAGDLAGGTLTDNTVNRKFAFKHITEKDRRWALNRIRTKMLDLSFHLNTGLYLIDIDNANRDLLVGALDSNPDLGNTEGYVGSPKTAFDAVGHATDRHAGPVKGLGSSFRNGQIHVSFDVLQAYSVLSYARVIIHEATHRYLGTVDHAYAHNPKYSTLHLLDAMDNADSYAWAAISLYCNAVKMGAPGSADWDQCA